MGMISIVTNGILLGLSITAPIGPTNIEVIRRGVKYGWKASFAFCVGVMFALLLYLSLVIMGFSFLTESTLFKNIMSGAGVVVLGYLIYISIKDFFKQAAIEIGEAQTSNKNLVQGFSLTICNPAILVLWTGIMGASLSSSSLKTYHYSILLCTGIIIGVIIFFIALIFIIHKGRSYLGKQYFRYVSLASGLVLAFFFVKFGYDLVLNLNASS
jgi:threonine/homoserine/homoserine lactone efflux protein